MQRWARLETWITHFRFNRKTFSSSVSLCIASLYTVSSVIETFHQKSSCRDILWGCNERTSLDEGRGTCFCRRETSWLYREAIENRKLRWLMKRYFILRTGNFEHIFSTIAVVYHRLFDIQFLFCLCLWLWCWFEFQREQNSLRVLCFLFTHFDFAVPTHLFLAFF